MDVNTLKMYFHRLIKIMFKADNPMRLVYFNSIHSKFNYSYIKNSYMCNYCNSGLNLMLKMA